jgi:hypothetical protein
MRKLRQHALTVWLAVFTGLVALALWQARENRAELEARSLANCREIEQIKEGARMAAWRDFNNLNMTLRLLKIEKTPEIVDAAKATRDRRLAQYRREPCPRKILSPP